MFSLYSFINLSVDALYLKFDYCIYDVFVVNMKNLINNDIKITNS